MKRQPIEIKRKGETGLVILWNDGSQQDISSPVLRANCPCAGCRELKPPSLVKAKQSALRVIDSSLVEQTRLEQVWPVGNYAIGVRWGDGHASGIYSYGLLSALRDS